MPQRSQRTQRGTAKTKDPARPGKLLADFRRSLRPLWQVWQVWVERLRVRRIAVVGAKGMLGRALREELARRDAEPILLDLPEFDLAEPDSVRRIFHPGGPDVILNAAGYTNVDGAEADPAAAERANVTGPRLIAEAAARAGALLVHVSSDYVFDGRKRTPYVEDDEPSPQGVYARTKLEGEEAVRRSGARHVIVRTAWMYAPWGRTFVLTILGKAKEGAPLRVVDDQRGSPTYAPDLARAILDLVSSDAAGTSGSARAALTCASVEGAVNVVNSGEATWFDLAAEAVRLAGLDVSITKIKTADLALPAPRPAYSVLSCRRLEGLLGRTLRPWREALAECVSLVIAT